MKIDQIRALYDKEQRQEIEFPDSQREDLQNVVRHVSITGEGGGWISYTRLNAGNADKTIQDQVAYYEALEQEFEWKLYDYDTPPDLKQRLQGIGFEIEEDEAIMVLEIEAALPVLLAPPPASIQRISDPGQVQDVASIEQQVWGQPLGWVVDFLRESLCENPDFASVYVAYLDGQPVSCAWTYFNKGQFASLWGGSTLEAYRKRGLYTGLLAARLQEARDRGYRFLTVDASPMSRPILEKYGFQLIAISNPCKWKPGLKEEK